MPSFDEALSLINGVDGWLTDGQAALLHGEAARCLPGERIVEIGSFRGRSTIVLAAAAPVGVEVVAIEPHAGTDRGPHEYAGYVDEANEDHVAFRANLSLAGMADRVRHVRRFSHDALGEVDGSIAVLYIDGAHRFRPALGDIRDWGRRVAPGGTLLIHDAFSSVGVTLAIGRELLAAGEFRYVDRSRSLVRYRRDLGAGPGPRLANAARQLLQLPWFALNLVVKVLVRTGASGWVSRVIRRPVEWPY
jgi:predicted O-methyltransferase YrrM